MMTNIHSFPYFQSKYKYDDRRKGRVRGKGYIIGGERTEIKNGGDVTVKIENRRAIGWSNIFRETEKSAGLKAVREV